MAGLASGGFIGLFVQLWLIATRVCCAAGPTLGQSIIAGLGIGFVAALIVTVLAVLHARLTFAGLFPAVLLVALLCGIVVAVIAPQVTPLGTIALLAPLVGYLLGLVFCILCRRAGYDPKGARR